MSNVEIFGIILGVTFGMITLICCIGAVFLNLFDRIDDERPDEEI